MATFKQRIPLFLVSSLLLTGILALGAQMPFYFDDAFISFRITENIREGIGPQLFQGKAVYSSTSLLYPFWNLIPAELHGKNWIDYIPYWNGCLMALAFCLILMKSAGPNQQKAEHLLWVLLPMLPWLLSPRNLVYGNSGLETSLYLLSLALCLQHEGMRILSPWLIFIRPEGWLAGCAAFIGCLIQKDKKGMAKLAVNLMASLLLWALAGYWLYGSILPQSISAKANHYIDRLNEIEKGLSYAFFAGQFIPFSAFLFASYKFRDFRAEILVPAIWAILYLLFFSLLAAWWPWYVPPLYAAFWYLGMRAGFRILGEYRLSKIQSWLLTLSLVVFCGWQLYRDLPAVKKSSEACKIRMKSSRALAGWLTDSIPKEKTILLEPLGMISWYGPELKLLDYPGLSSVEMSEFLKHEHRRIPHRLTDPAINSVILKHFRPDVILQWPEEYAAFAKTGEFRKSYQLRKTLSYFPEEKQMDTVRIFMRHELN